MQRSLFAAMLRKSERFAEDGATGKGDSATDLRDGKKLHPESDQKLHEHWALPTSNWLGRQDSQPVFIAAKSLISLTQKTRFTPQKYSELAQFFKRKNRPFAGGNAPTSAEIRIHILRNLCGDNILSCGE